jgi:hypothetical protein
LSGKAQKGLILHHGRGGQFGKDEPPQRISAEMLARIEEVLATEASQTKGGATAQRQPSHFLGEYSDPLSEGSEQKYWGAVERVVLTQPGGERRDTGWLVLVQEPVERRRAVEQ